ncbi:MAG: hypothetical protein I4N51_00340, partial [Acinetobacter sp.]|nr:hypothetical protein [Acinetobacter sp.]
MQQGLKADELGFLVGKPINLTDLHDELTEINEELSEIKDVLLKDKTVELGQDTIDKLIGGLASENNKSASKQTEKISVPASHLSSGATGSTTVNNSEVTNNHSSGLDKTEHKKTVASPFRISNPKGANGPKNTVVNIPKSRESKVTVVAQVYPSLNSSGNNRNRQRDRFASPNHRTSNEETTDLNGNKQSGRLSGDHRQVNSNRNKDPRISEPNPRDKKLSSAENQKPAQLRASNGRFVSKNEADSVNLNIKSIGNKISDAVSGIGSGNDQADPSVQAMGEIKGVLTPVGRGFGKIFGGGTNGLSRGQDRWYRRFWKKDADKAHRDEVANKAEQKLLSKIERKKAPEAASRNGLLASLLLGFMGVLTTLLLKGFQTLVSPLKFLGIFFAPLLKVLQGLLRLIGLKSLGDRLGSPAARQRHRGRSHTGGRSGEASPRNGAGGAAAKTGKALLKRLPIVGALMSAGFLAKDLSDIAESDASKRLKTNRVGSAIGSTAGGIGGAFGGAAAGAAIGSVIPLVGTVAGGIVGAVLGGIGGDKVGGMLGDKFGDWVNELRDSGFIDRMSHTWSVGVNAMGIMWRDFTSLAASVWNG